MIGGSKQREEGDERLACGSHIHFSISHASVHTKRWRVDPSCHVFFSTWNWPVWVTCIKISSEVVFCENKSYSCGKLLRGALKLWFCAIIQLWTMIATWGFVYLNCIVYKNDLYQVRLQQPLIISIFVIFLGIVSIVTWFSYLFSGNRREKKLKKGGQVITSQTGDHSCSILLFDWEISDCILV